MLGRIHGLYVHKRRVQALGSRIADLLPRRATVLDVGCGDGQLARVISDRRPDVRIQGIDVLVRRDSHIAVTPFDGKVIPLEDDSVDVAIFVDVLHHAHDPWALLCEGARVARSRVIIKDHDCQGLLARPILRFMDWIGNARHGVELPYNYWTSTRWTAAFDRLGLERTSNATELSLYPKFVDWIFGRDLHFLASLDKKVEIAYPMAAAG